MKILSSNGGIASTNAYLIVDESTGDAVLFDAPDHTTKPLLDAVEKNKWNLIGLWLTHGHFDHVADHAEVTARFPKAKVLIHKLDEPKLIDPTSKFFELPFTIPARKADGYVEDQQELKIGNLKVNVIFTPGHSPGHVMFHVPEEETLVGGDLIIMGAIGRYDLPDSNRDDLFNSIRKVMELPKQTRLLPGHGNPSTLADEMANNPYVQEALGSAR